MEKFKIYIDRLKHGHIEKIDVTTPPSFLEVDEESLVFSEDVRVEGQAYLAEDHLVVQVDFQTAAFIPCSICNQPVRIPIDIRDHYFTEPLTEVHSAIFDITNEVR